MNGRLRHEGELTAYGNGECVKFISSDEGVMGTCGLSRVLAWGGLELL